MLQNSEQWGTWTPGWRHDPINDVGGMLLTLSAHADGWTCVYGVEGHQSVPKYTLRGHRELVQAEACEESFGRAAMVLLLKFHGLLRNELAPGCILNLDSPSLPPDDDERRQCGCPTCVSELPSSPETPAAGLLCSDCPPVGYPDKTRCTECPRREQNNAVSDAGRSTPEPEGRTNRHSLD